MLWILVMVSEIDPSKSAASLSGSVVNALKATVAMLIRRHTAML